MKLPSHLDSVQLYPHMKEIEAIVRDCAKVCEELGKDIVCPEECAVAILAHYRLEDKP